MSYYQTLERWHQLVATIKTLQDEERALREGIFKGTFADPKEGVNTVALPDGRTLKGTYKLNRTVDQAGVLLLPKKVREAAFKAKFDLSLSAYRTLDEETQKVVDGVLTVSPGMPQLELVEAKPKVLP